MSQRKASRQGGQPSKTRSAAAEVDAKEPLVMVNVRLPASLAKRLKLLAAANDVAIQTVVQDALEKHMTLNNQAREELKALLLSQRPLHTPLSKKPLHTPGARRGKEAK